MVEEILQFQKKFTKILNRISRISEVWQDEDLADLDIVETKVIEHMRKTTIELVKVKQIVTKTRST